MKHIYALILCISVCIGNAQTKNFEFSFLSRKSILTIEINNYSDSAELLFVRKLTDTLDNKNSKLYFTIDENGQDVIVKFNSPDRFAMGGPIKRVSDKKMHPFFFNTATDTLNSIVPISLLVEFKDDNNADLKETLSKILKCQKIEAINKKDIELVLKRSHAMTIITYKIESIE